MKRVAILGASNKKTRYSRTAQELLAEKGYEVVPVSRSGDDILGVKSYQRVGEIPGKIDTLTVYLSPKHLAEHVDDIVRSDIRRVIFNPGTENEPLRKKIEESGKFVLEACSIVLLKTGQFDKS